MNPKLTTPQPDLSLIRSGLRPSPHMSVSLSDERREQCELCGLLFSPEELQQFGPFTLCPDCGTAYCDACFQEYGDAFIEENAHTFYTGWFEGLTETEQLRALQAAYRACYQAADSTERARMHEERREFCSACINEAWPVYVAKRLNATYNGILN